MTNIGLAIRYWARATVRPASTFAILKAHPSKVAIAFWINLIFAAMYTVTVIIYFRIGRLPAIEPWCQSPPTATTSIRPSGRFRGALPRGS